MDSNSCNYDAEATLAGPCSHLKTDSRDCEGKCVKVTYVKVKGASCAARGYMDLLDAKQCRDAATNFSITQAMDTSPDSRNRTSKLTHG